MNYIKLFNEINDDDIELVGGKALSLGLLTKAKLPVPPGFVITTEAYTKYNRSGVDTELKQTILLEFDKLGFDRVAVRSSAIAEDSAGASWAGQFESYLNVTREQLIESIEKCWQSASTDIVDSYAESQSISKDRLAVAVVIQKMVNSEVAGVAFSVNPITKNDSEIMIEAVYGLGELLVQGMATPDNYVISKDGFTLIDKQIKDKNRMMVLQNGENIEIPVPDNKRSESCLDEENLRELSKLVKEIEKYYGKPQDIEWAIEKGSIYVVQSRPITTL